MKTHDYIEKYRTPKAELARMIGLHRTELYAYLEPTKYPAVRLTDEKLQKIAEFEGRSLRAVRSDYEKAAA